MGLLVEGERHFMFFRTDVWRTPWLGLANNVRLQPAVGGRNLSQQHLRFEVGVNFPELLLIAILPEPGHFAMAGRICAGASTRDRGALAGKRQRSPELVRANGL
jgi:hypothetical protein